MINRLSSYLGSLYRHYSRETNKRPSIMSYLLTNKCNSHCIMCSVWKNAKQTQIDIDKLKVALSNPVFSGIKHVGISGGEPSLCNDLYHQVETLIKQLSHLRSISITTNCINDKYWKSILKDIFALCRNNGIYFQLNISIDGIGVIHDKIRGTKGNFESADSILQYAKKEHIPFQIQSTVNRYNVYHLSRILSYAKENDADVIFRLASPISRLENRNQLARISLNDKEASFFCDFLRSSRLDCSTRSSGRKLFYSKLAVQILGDGHRVAPCYFKQDGIVLSPDGNLSFCSRFDSPFSDIYNPRALETFKDNRKFEECENHTCDFCYHDQSGLWSPKDVLKLYLTPFLVAPSKIWYVIKDLTKAIAIRPCISTEKDVCRICIIGMYGGGHVGDAAILGGVITRLRSRYPSVTHFSVFSFRKDRTKCWVGNLKRISDDIIIDVIDDEACFESKIRESQLLAWAGGPLMDIPVILTRHFMFIKIALHSGCRFEIEGVGYGPMSGFYGKTVANRILNAANHISVRSSKDAAILSKMGYVSFGAQIDPAFDYLNILENQELIIDPQKKRGIDALINNHSFMALNLRPLWDKYGRNKRFDYNRFLDEIVSVIEYMSENGIKTIFFPMNADQFGFSDLEVAYELEKRFSCNSYFSIWETEPSIEEVVYLLRKAKLSLCMRYHAVIFSMSQKIPTFGIDYSLNGLGKVSTLLNDDNCFSMSTFKSEKVVRILESYVKKLSDE